MHKAFVITDLTFGDAGKGTLTDALARRGAGLVVRANGGAQAAHTVVDEAGREHVFHQFGSGTLVDGVQTLLSRFMMVNPLALHYEELELLELGVSDAAERMFIDARALVTTPFQMIFNQLRELARGAQRHGSCGLGIGETAADALDFESQVLRYGDLFEAARLRRKLLWHRDLKLQQLPQILPQLWQQTAQSPQICALLDQLHSEAEMVATREVFGAISDRFGIAPPDFLAARLRQPGTTVFEGAQGVLLDENHGFHPHTTWSKTTPANALQLIAATGCEVQTTVMGLTRAYQTRHGVGPFPTESAAVTEHLPDPHNPTNQWQGPFRAGWLDLSLLRYAIEVSGRIDGLVMTCLDRFETLPEVKIGVGYRFQGNSWRPTPSSSNDLLEQEKIGKTLGQVKVKYCGAASDPRAYAEEIAQRLGLPLLGTSSGPTAQDKWLAFG